MNRLRELPDPTHLPALRPEYAHTRPALGLGDQLPPPRILLLYGSLRERSYSKLLTLEAARLLQAGVDPDRRSGADLTALMWAAGHSDSAPASGALATVKLLLAKGAKVDLLDDRGRSALMIAASLGHVEIVRTLLAAGADKGLRDKGGKRAADLAVSDELRQLLSSP